MALDGLKDNIVFKFLSNRYILILIVFLVWMFFFDENSYINHRKLNKEIDKLEKSNAYDKREIKQDRKKIKNLQDPDSLEKFAREEYKMKRKNEDIYIIEADTIEKE